MSNKAAFEDCAFPHDCECSKRGYQLERDNCAVHDVAGSAASLGLDPAGLFGGKAPPAAARKRLTGIAAGIAARPTLAATNSGTVLRLGDSGDLNRDVLHALRALDPETPLDAAAVDRIIRAEKAAAGLRAEAGVAGRLAVFFCTRVERFRDNLRLMRWTKLQHYQGLGDIVTWQVAVLPNGDAPVDCGTRELWETMLRQIQLAAGGAGEIETRWTEPPSDEELRDLEFS